MLLSHVASAALESFGSCVVMYMPKLCAKPRELPPQYPAKKSFLVIGTLHELRLIASWRLRAEVSRPSSKERYKAS